MKLIKLLVFISPCLIARGQNYDILPDSCSVWKYDWYMFGEYQYTLIFKMNPQVDTSIGGANYHPVTMIGGTPPNFLIGAIRESGGKAYYVMADSLSEILLFDFSLSIGDTVYNAFSYHVTGFEPDKARVYDAVVIKKDSVLNNGQYLYAIELEGLRVSPLNCYPCWNSSSTPWTITWSEKSTHGSGGLFLHWRDVFEGEYMYAGYCTSDTLLTAPSKPSYCSNCDYTVGIPGQTTFDIDIFPNPFGDIITLVSQIMDAQVRIYDIAGKLMLTENFTGAKNIYTGRLGKGLYLVTLSRQGQPLLRKKMVKL